MSVSVFEVCWAATASLCWQRGHYPFRVGGHSNEGVVCARLQFEQTWRHRLWFGEGTAVTGETTPQCYLQYHDGVFYLEARLIDMQHRLRVRFACCYMRCMGGGRDDMIPMH